jgi:uncharacterized protein (TIGR00290 family)
MPGKPKAIFNWSGGKDSSLCLYKVLKAGEYEIAYLLTSLSEKYDRVSQHGVRATLLKKQVESIGLPLHKLILPEWPTMESYNAMMKKTLDEFKEQNIAVSIFGDIYLEDLREYREARLSEAGFRGIFPLWKIPTDELAKEFIDLGFKAITVCVDEKKLDKSFAGREFNKSFLNDLPRNVDPCGENGEFHTFVYEGPIFAQAISFVKGEIVYRNYVQQERNENNADDYTCSSGDTTSLSTGLWYCDLLSEHDH